MGDIIDLHVRVVALENAIAAMAEVPAIKQVLEDRGVIKKEELLEPKAPPRTRQPVRI